MTSLQPQCDQNGRYSHSETCNILGISSKTLYRHSPEKIKFGMRKSNGRRFYLGSEIIKYWRSQY